MRQTSLSKKWRISLKRHRQEPQEELQSLWSLPQAVATSDLDNTGKKQKRLVNLPSGVRE